MRTMRHASSVPHSALIPDPVRGTVRRAGDAARRPAGMDGSPEDDPTSGDGGPFGALAPTTWFGIPAVPGDYVRRPRLFRLLDRGAFSPLILVSAPAGSGKTSLVADWLSLRASDEQTEWVTFEREDEAFWPGVLGGLARLGVAVPSRSFPAGTARGGPAAPHRPRDGGRERRHAGHAGPGRVRDGVPGRRQRPRLPAPALRGPPARRSGHPSRPDPPAVPLPPARTGSPRSGWPTSPSPMPRSRS